MPYLSFISDANLEAEVKKILTTAKAALHKAESELGKNVIDPFSVMFEMAGFDIDKVDNWIVNEKTRQSQKTLSNAFGNFHQNILGHVDGWTNLGIGHSADLECLDKKIIAEVKNKFNTVTGGKQCDVYDHLHGLVMPVVSKYKNFTAFYVETIPKPKSNKAQTYNVPFTPSESKSKTKKAANEFIRKIDGSSFYHLATDQPDALEELYSVLPKVISNVSSYSFSQSEIDMMNLYFRQAFKP